MLRRRRLFRALGPAVLLAVGGAYALASWNWCGAWGQGEPAVLPPVGPRGAVRRRGRGSPIGRPGRWWWPATRRPAPRPGSAELPLLARALVLQVGRRGWGWSRWSC